MILDDIKDKVREKLAAGFARLQETSAYSDLSEKFESLSPSGQKGVIAGVAFLLGLILLAVPYTLLSSSSDTVTEFEDKRNLIRELFRTKHESAILDTAVPAITPQDLLARSQNQINSAQLQPEQIRGVGPYDNSGPQASPIIPKGVIQQGVNVSLAKLNMRQLVDIGHQLQAVHPSAKMIGMEVTANRDNAHFFDVIYKLVSFSMPAEPVAKPKGKSSLKRGSPKPPAEE